MSDDYGLKDMLGGLFGTWKPDPPQKPAPKPATPKPVAKVAQPPKAAPTLAPAPAPAPAAQSTGSSKGDRNRNPGNLEDGPFARSQPGYVGTDGRFAKFDTAENGSRAQIALLNKNYAGMSPAQIIQKYAPLGDNSEASVRNYIGYISARAGVDPDSVVKPDQMTKLAAAMREFETGRTAKGVAGTYKGNLAGAKSQATGTPTNSNATAWLTSAVPGEVKATKQAGLTPEGSSAIFGEGAKQLNSRRANLETGLAETTGAISVLNAATQAAQAQEVTQQTEQVAAIRQVNETMTTGTQQLTEQAKPVFEARNRVADQILKNATMNPIEKAFRGIFDSNYDDDFLQGQLKTFQTVLDAKAYNYDYMNKLSNDAVAEINQRYGLNMASSKLAVTQATEDLSLLEKHVANMNAVMNSGQENLQVQSQLLVAQRQARVEVLGQTDEPTLQEKLAEANSPTNGGQVTIGGATFSATEVRNEMQARETQKIAVRSHQLAIANGEMSLADNIAKDIAFKATRSELEAALTNGGLIRGVQVPADTLNLAIKNQRDIAEGQAQDALIKMPAAMAVDQANTLTKMSTQLFERSRGILGTEGQNAMAPILGQVSASATELNAAIESGQPQEVINALLARHQKLTQVVGEQIDARILASTNGDKVTAGVVSNFIRGVPMTEGASIEALTHAAIKGNLPNSLSMGPEAKLVFGAAQKIISENRYKDNKGTPRSESELQAIVADQLAPRIQALVGNPRLARVINNLPSYAKVIGSPLGNINPAWWTRTLDAAQQTAIPQFAQALTRMGKKVGDKTLTFTPADVSAIMSGNFNPSAVPGGAEMVQLVKQNSGIYNAAETTVIVQKLESIVPLTDKTTNSELYEDLLASPELTNRLSKEEQIIGANSFGDYLLGPLSRGATANTLSEYRQSVGKVNRARDDRGYEDFTLDTSVIRSVKGRFLVMGQAMPGVGDEGTMLLMQAMYNDGYRYPDSSPDGAGDVATYNWLSNHKFQDPKVDGYRRRFVNEYPEVSKYVPKIHEAMVKARQGIRSQGNR